MTKICLFLTCLLASGLLPAQMHRYYGGCGRDFVSDVVFDGSRFHVLGTSNSFTWGENDMYYFSVDTNGVEQTAWVLREDHEQVTATSILRLSASQTILMGYFGNSGDHDVVSISNSGTIDWALDIPEHDFKGMTRSAGGNVILYGQSRQNSLYRPTIVVVDSSGTIVESHYFQTPPNNTRLDYGDFKSCAINAQGNYVLTAHISFWSLSVPNQYVLYLELDAQFGMVRHSYHNIVAQERMIRDLNVTQPTANGGWLVGGGTQEGAFLMELDSTGSHQWTQHYEMPDRTSFDWLKDLQVTASGDILALHSRGPVFKLDTQGNLEWAYFYEPINSGFFTSYDNRAIFPLNGKYWLFCNSDKNPMSTANSPAFNNFDIRALPIAPDGSSAWVNDTATVYVQQPATQSLNSPLERVSHSVSTNNLSLTSIPATTVFNDPAQCQGVSIDEDQKMALVLHPNPTQGLFHMEATGIPAEMADLHLYNVQGKLIGEFRWNMAEPFVGSLENAAPGIYFVTVRTATHRKSFRLVKQ